MLVPVTFRLGWVNTVLFILTGGGSKEVISATTQPKRGSDVVLRPRTIRDVGCAKTGETRSRIRDKMTHTYGEDTLTTRKVSLSTIERSITVVLILYVKRDGRESRSSYKPLWFSTLTSC